MEYVSREMLGTSFGYLTLIDLREDDDAGELGLWVIRDGGVEEEDAYP